MRCALEKWKGLAVRATAGTAIALIAGAAGAGEVEDAIDEALRDVEAGRCDAAEERVAAIPGLSSRARLLAGQCEIRASRYPEALERLNGIRGDGDLSREQVGDVELYRAIALYHLERYGEAEAALDGASGLTRDEAQLTLYRGLLALREGDNDRAAPALESAARLAPEVTEPVASYYAGLAWLGAAERGRARDAFQRVIDRDGDGSWGKEAKKLLDSTELYPYFVRARIGMEFDHNALLRGDVGQILDQNGANLTESGEEDWRGVWEFDAGVQLFQSDDAEWSGGLTASYQGNAYVELHDINLHYPTVGAYLSKRVATNTLAQARYQFGHAWVDEQPYQRNHIAELSMEHTWTRAGTTTVRADFVHLDLRFRSIGVVDGPIGTPGSPCTSPLAPCSPPGIDEETEGERDGWIAGGGIDHRYLIPVPDAIDNVIEQAVVGGGYRYGYSDSEGSEWKYHAHALQGSFEVELPLDVSVVTSLRYEFRDFLQPSIFPDVQIIGFEYGLSTSDRKEHELFFVGEVEKDLTENVSVSARYSYLDNESNRSVYDFDRHIVGGYLNLRFD